MTDRLNFRFQTSVIPLYKELDVHLASWNFTRTAFHVPLFQHLPLFSAFPFLYHSIRHRLTDLMTHEAETLIPLSPPTNLLLFMKRLLGLGLEHIFLTKHNIFQLHQEITHAKEEATLISCLGALTAALDRCFRRLRMYRVREEWARRHLQALNIKVKALAHPDDVLHQLTSIAFEDAISTLQLCLLQVLEHQNQVVAPHLSTLCCALSLLRSHGAHLDRFWVTDSVGRQRVHRQELCEGLEKLLLQEYNQSMSTELDMDFHTHKVISLLFALTYLLKARYTIPSAQLQSTAKLVSGLHPSRIPALVRIQLRRLRTLVGHTELSLAIQAKLQQLQKTDALFYQSNVEYLTS